jgi:hypothetical protein
MAGWIHLAEPLVPNPISFVFQTDIEKFQRCKSWSIDQILAEFV